MRIGIGRAVKRSVVPLICVLTLSFILPRLVSLQPSSNALLPHAGKIVVIDPGHGGIDGGVVGKTGSVEAALNLQVSLKLRDYLRQLGITVVMTRETDEGLKEPGKSWSKSRDMRMRIDIVKAAQPHLLISIHMNSFPGASVFGAQVFYAKGSEQGMAFANLMQENLREFQPNNKRLAKAEEFYMLMQTPCPAILVECGFLSNREEEALLKDDHYQSQLAWYLMRGVTKYLEQTEQTDAKNT